MRDQIQEFLVKLISINEQFRETGEVDLGWERLDRWKRQVSQFLAENISEEEAQPFRGGVDPWIDLGDEVRRCSTALVALFEELQTRPEVVRKPAIATPPPSADSSTQQASDSPSATPLEAPKRVTLSWLWHNVPVPMWLSAAAVVGIAFMAGFSIANHPQVRELLGVTTDHPKAPQPQLPAAEAKQFVYKVDKLIEAHNNRLADLQTQLLYEEKKSADELILSVYQDKHKDAAGRIRKLIQDENNNFQRELELLKRFSE